MMHHSKKSLNILFVRRLSGIVLALTVVLTASCVYFNTYYNAITAFDDARKAHRKVTPDGVDSIVSAPSQSITGYTRAIEKAAKILEFYPKDKDWHDDALYVIARSYFYKGESAKGAFRFKQLIDQFTQSPFVPECHIYLAKIYISDGFFSKAEDELTLVTQLWPERNKDGEISLLWARLALRQGSKISAITTLEKQLSAITNPSKKNDLILEIAHIYVEIKQYDKAIFYIKMLELPRTTKASATLIYRSDCLTLECYTALDSMDAAHATIDKMLKEKKNALHVPVLLFKRGQLYENAGKTQKAIETYRKIASDYDTTNSAAQAYEALGTLFIARGEYLQAKACIDSAYNKYKDPLSRSDVLVKKTALESLLFLSRSLVTDTADSVTNRKSAEDIFALQYKFGELLWLDLRSPDSALVCFKRLADDTSGSVDGRSHALFSAAWILRYSRHDSIAAAELFEKVIVSYPSTEYAKQSQQELGRPVSLFTRKDSAENAFAAIDRELSDSASNLGLVDSFLSVYRNFGETDAGARALYTAAWIWDDQDTKIGNYRAVKYYRLLCDSIPTCVYCQKFARPRLQILVDTAEALLAGRKTTLADAAALSIQKKGKADSLAAKPAIAKVDSVLSIVDILSAKTTIARSDSILKVKQNGPVSKSVQSIAPQPAGNVQGDSLNTQYGRNNYMRNRGGMMNGPSGAPKDVYSPPLPADLPPR